MLRKEEISILKENVQQLQNQLREAHKVIKELEEIKILKGSIKDLQEQVQESFKKIKELGENNERTTREN
jgi:predicted  nucleic acid-binding Zn-ribbon protein